MQTTIGIIILAAAVLSAAAAMAENTTSEKRAELARLLGKPQALISQTAIPGAGNAASFAVGEAAIPAYSADAARHFGRRHEPAGR